MSKNLEELPSVEVLVNTSFEETRIAILEDSRVNELIWERRGSLNIVGNIYKGTVENVLPGISSAFLNIGYEKNAYLYISDVIGGDKKNIDKVLKLTKNITVSIENELYLKMNFGKSILTLKTTKLEAVKWYNFINKVIYA